MFRGMVGYYQLVVFWIVISFGLVACYQSLSSS
jgi:hypothetical protein